MELLCQAGASTAVTNQEEESPLHVAAARGHSDCIRCLLDSQAALDTQVPAPSSLSVHREITFDFAGRAWLDAAASGTAAAAQ